MGDVLFAAAEEAAGEEAAEGLVVEGKPDPGEDDDQGEQGEADRPDVGEGQGVGPDPGVEQVHDRIMGDVEGVGDGSHEFADTR